MGERRVASDRQQDEVPPPTVAPASFEAVGLHRISQAQDAARRAWRVMILLAVLSTLLIVLTLAAVLR
jgi:hypothetical protein